MRQTPGAKDSSKPIPLIPVFLSTRSCFVPSYGWDGRGNFLCAQREQEGKGERSIEESNDNSCWLLRLTLVPGQ